MRKRATTTVALLAGLVVISLFAVVWRTNRYERAFEVSSPGEQQNVIVGRFGEPSVREMYDRPFLRYASEACKSPCTTRLWWEHPIFRGIEAWSVEFGSEGQMLQKAHWVSP